MIEDRKMRKIKRLAATLLALALIFAACSAQAASYSAKVFSPYMKVYASPSTSASCIGALSQGRSFTVKAISGSWARVEYKGRTGYAQMQDIIFSNRIRAVVTKNSSFNYVTKASFRDKKYYSGSIQAGVTVYVVGIHGSYLLVSNSSGSILGYIKSGNVKKA